MLDAAQQRDAGVEMAYSPTSSLRRLSCSKSLVGGPMMNGLIEPFSRSAGRLELLTHTRTGTPMSPTRQPRRQEAQPREQLDTHLQGSAVDTVGYYETLVENSYQNLRVKTGWSKRMGPASVAVGNGNPHRNYSAISLGDRFYFNGPHMFQVSSPKTMHCRPAACPTCRPVAWLPRDVTINAHIRTSRWKPKLTSRQLH